MSGAYRVTTTVQVKEKLCIFDEVWAVADGTIVAYVYEDDKEIEIANLVLLVNGVFSKIDAVGMGVLVHIWKKQIVKFITGKMWLLECCDVNSCQYEAIDILNYLFFKG